MFHRAARIAAPLIVLGGLLAAVPALRAALAPPARPVWSAEGTLLEACTCAVPCTCNFGQGPSPHAYCHSVWAYKIEKGAWGGTDLSGLIFGGADGPKGGVGFLDQRALPAQRPALEKLARAVFARGGPSGGPRPFAPARITHEIRGNDLRLDIDGNSRGGGGFAARVLVGGDGKTPIVVENNTIWPIRRAIKAKTTQLRFREERVGAIGGEGTNANYGAFAFTGRTSEAAAGKGAGASCCASE